MNEIRSQLEAALQSGFSDHTMEKVKKQYRELCDEMEISLWEGIRASIAYNLASYSEQQAKRAIEAILKGDEEQLRVALSCREGGYTGRDGRHEVIHGRMFEAGAIALRKQIVEAHAELLKTERVLDLEDQVRSLVAQVNKLEARLAERARLEQSF
jgi:hypothetical protein